MQQQIDQVVTERLLRPESVFQPESRMDERVVLRDRRWLEPDPPDASQSGKGGIVLDIGIIIPDEARPQRRDVRNHSHDGDENEHEDRALAFR